MNTQLTLVSAAVLAVSLSTSASADVVVDWDLTGMAGTETIQAANSFATGITGNALTEGAGLTANAGGNSMNAKGWNNESTDYFSFGFNVGNGYKADLASLVIGTRSSGTGPGTMGLFYNGDNYATALYTFDQAPGNNYVNSIVDLSALQNLTGTIEFRVAQIGTNSAAGGTTSGAGTFRIAEYYDGANYTNLQLNGTVAAIPEADTYTMLLAGLGLVGFVARRRLV